MEAKATSSQSSKVEELPSAPTLQNIAKLAVIHDKPAMFDYWCDSLDNKVIIGVKETDSGRLQYLVKSEDEYTSPVEKIYKVGGEYIIMTENSIYVVSSKISTKRITN